MNNSKKDLDQIQQWRADTPGCAHKIHLNNAGASLLPTSTFESVEAYLKEEFLNGGYETALKYQDLLQQTYQQVADLIHASPSEIAFMENATAAWNMAFLSLNLQEGDEIITSTAAYASNFIIYLQAKKRYGLQIRVIPNLAGSIDLEALQQQINSRTKLISITHIPTNGGMVQPAEAIGEIAQQYDIPYLLDACQSVGQYPIDVQKIGCSFLSATGRKYLRGPRGTGFLYVNQSILHTIEPIMLDLKGAIWETMETYSMASNATRFENWERSPALQLGIGQAATYAQHIGMERIWNRVQFLGGLLREKLHELPEVRVMDNGQVRCGIVSIALKGKDPAIVKAELLASNINVSLIDPNGTLMDSLERQLPPMIRASVHYYNTEEELDQFKAQLKEHLY